MANIDLSKVHAKVEYSEFPGVDKTKLFAKDRGGLFEINNFRIRKDGALEKRSGFEYKMHLGGNPRAFYRLSADEILLLIRNEIYLINLRTNSKSFIGNVNGFSGDACFFSFDGNVFLSDGDEIYIYKNQSFVTANGYAPLYGKDWNPDEIGNVNEPLNMASNHVRISYRTDARVPSTPKGFRLPFAIDSVDAVYVNGVRWSVSNFPISTEYPAIANSAEFIPNSEVLFFITANTNIVKKPALCKCKRVAFFGDGSKGLDRTSLAFYDGENPKEIYTSHSVSKEKLRECQKFYDDSVNIYVNADDMLLTEDAIKASCRKDSSLIVFSEGKALALSLDSEGSAVLYPLSANIGCSSKDGALLYGDTPITVSSNGIYKWTPDDFGKGDYLASCISAEINSSFSREFFENAIIHYCQSRDEIWVKNPLDSKGRVFIYSAGLKKWYTFSGIPAVCIFESGGKLGFFDDHSLYIFNDILAVDKYRDEERRIDAYIASNLLFASNQNERKKLSRCILRTSQGTNFSLTIKDDRNSRYDFSLSDKSSEAIGYIERKLVCPRSRHFSFVLNDMQQGKTVIYGIILCTLD